MRREVGVVSRRPSLFFREIDLLAMWQIRPQLGRLLGIEFVRFRDLLIDDVRIAVVSTSAWLMPTDGFQIPGLSQGLVARPWWKSRNRKFSTLAFALMRSTASRG